jgi:hypothetical protein
MTLVSYVQRVLHETKDVECFNRNKLTASRVVRLSTFGKIRVKKRPVKSTTTLTQNTNPSLASNSGPTVVTSVKLSNNKDAVYAAIQITEEACG